MKRIPEPELMLDPGQVSAYANADFEGPHSAFIDIFRSTFPNVISGKLLELGCGNGDITFRISRQFPGFVIDAVDGSGTMIEFAEQKLKEPDMTISSGITFHHSMINDFHPDGAYDVIVSNSLLHHLHDPMILWKVIRNNAVKGSCVFIMDLRRPDSFEEAMKLVRKYSEDEPDILKKDFFNSLIASFKAYEVRKQLVAAGMSELKVEEIGDRHQIIYGTLLSDKLL